MSTIQNILCFTSEVTYNTRVNSAVHDFVYFSAFAGAAAIRAPAARVSVQQGRVRAKHLSSRTTHESKPFSSQIARYMPVPSATVTHSRMAAIPDELDLDTESTANTCVFPDLASKLIAAELNHLARQLKQLLSPLANSWAQSLLLEQSRLLSGHPLLQRMRSMSPWTSLTRRYKIH